MIRPTWRDESGAALGLAVILIVVIGVMAAGLLAVLRSELEGTIQANRGQRALQLADAGAQAGAARLRADPNPEHYDEDGPGNSDWAEIGPDGRESGKALALGEDAATVTIRYLLPATNDDELEDRLRAPERVPGGLDDYPDRDYFLVVSEGSSGGTRRRIEVIVCVKSSGDSREIVRWSWREVYE